MGFLKIKKKKVIRKGDFRYVRSLITYKQLNYGCQIVFSG